MCQGSPRHRESAPASQVAVGRTGAIPCCNKAACCANRLRQATLAHVRTQVKSLSFIGHTLRQMKQHASQAVQDGLATLPAALVHLLRHLPEGCLGARKELMAATRHLLNTPYRCAHCVRASVQCT